MSDIDMIVRSIVENVEKIDVSKLRRSDVQIIGMLKELITLSNNVVRKLMCLKEHKNIKISGAVCGRKWVFTETDHYISIYKLGFGGSIFIDKKEKMIMIRNREYGIIFSPYNVAAYIPTYKIEIDLRRVERISERSTLISKSFSKTLETLKRADEDFTKCVKTERIRC
ncbi:MAG: hypothetical protein GU359_04080 [Desulfurococcales archaeon]|jgi:hypothetical protein|nr:hypothetical protein [Desulfurococcales archaeon]